MIIINTLNLLGLELIYMLEYLDECLKYVGTNNGDEFHTADGCIAARLDPSNGELLIVEEEFDELESFMNPIREKLGLKTS